MGRKTIFYALLTALVAAFLIPTYRAWAERQGVIPPGITLAGMSINGSSLAEVDAQLQDLFNDPVAVYYDDERIILRPEEIGFRVKTRVMIGQAREMGNGFYMTRAFLLYLLGRSPTPRDVPLLVEWDPEQLDAWLTEIAARYDRPPRAPFLNMEDYTWREGAPGHVLNKEASIPRIIAALKQVGDRRVARLVVEDTPPPRPAIQVLEEALRARTDAFPGISAVFVRLLSTGEEVNVDAADVPFSGMSTMKIPIMLAVYGELDELPSGTLRAWMTETVTSTTGAGNYTANRLLRFLGDGDMLAGAEKVTTFLRSLGMENSFIIAPYDWRKAPPRTVRTPANQNPRYPTDPDPLVQTTPKEIALIMEMVVTCAEGKGTLLAAYPDRFTPEECQDLLSILALNPVTEALLPGGLPEGTRYVHKHGYAPDTHGDVAAVWGPEGVYVISLFLSTPNQWLVWDTSNSTFMDVSRITWDFFALRQRAP